MFIAALPTQKDTWGSGLTKSNCACLPDSGQPCELLDYIKRNYICRRCNVRLGRGPINSTSADRLSMVKIIKTNPSMALAPIELSRKASSNTYYGSVCNRKHIVKNPETGKPASIRYYSGKACAECIKENSRKWHRRKKK